LVARWYRNAVVYSLDVRTFQDSNGDGIGDLPGLVSRLDYLSRIGATALWLNPIHPSPCQDGGYDITDHYGIDPDLGTLGDFAELMNLADERGLRVILDLVVNHTSFEHPWFQSARSDPRSPYRKWYIWSEGEPPDRAEGMVFPGVQEATWTYDDSAGGWYHHRFYDFEPDLDITNPEVREEIGRIVAFWERLGVSGFRLDAAPFVIEQIGPDIHEQRRYGFLTELREQLSWQRGDAVFLAEAHVPTDELGRYYGTGEGAASRAQMVFGFQLNQQMMLALARQDARPLAEAFERLPALPRHGQWATFLRNHDEVDLSGLQPDERADVFAVFGPERRHQLYERGIRRRPAPMLGDANRLRMAYSLQFTMPGTPVLRYGDEIGMGEDLSLPERTAIRTPMQWSPAPNAGFSSTPDSRQLVAPVVTDGPYGCGQVNVTDQRRDPESLLLWFERMLHTLRECQEIGVGQHRVLDAGVKEVLVHRADAPSGSVLFVHNLSESPAVVGIPASEQHDGSPVELFQDEAYDTLDLEHLDVHPYGYRWIRLHRDHARW
jgi:maltose alpha-D-glucosyltransferase/alpha-amylase